MQVTNQKPVTLSPIYKSTIVGTYDVLSYIKNMLVSPLFTPLVASSKVKISAGKDEITEDIIMQNIMDCCGATVNPVSETFIKELFSKTLENFTNSNTVPIQNVFANQSATKANLPFPSSNVIYTPATDIIPTCKSFLSGKADYDELFASFAFYARPDILGFYFVNEIAFNEFKEWFKNKITPLKSGLSAEVNSLCNDFDKLELTSLTESLKIRNDENHNNEDYSFARILITMLFEYTNVNNTSLFGVMPFSLNELICPQNIVFVNVEKHAHASAVKIRDEWQMIDKSLRMPIKMISNNRLSKLTAVARNMQKAASAASSAISSMNNQTARAMNFKFRKTELTSVDITKIIKKVMDKMAFVNKSENSYKSVKMTFARPNRRNPDDFNKQGKMVSTKYKPDIHLYIDTSGSISERNYQDAIKACIVMAKKLNVNLYFNSFSHVLSQTTHLKTKDKSKSQVFKEFRKVPKVTGGTDYEQIWHYINKNKKRKRELSIIITDFEWRAPNRFVKHPKNLYYMPCSNMNINNMTYWAEEFCKSMVSIKPDIRKNVLF